MIRDVTNYRRYVLVRIPQIEEVQTFAQRRDDQSAGQGETGTGVGDDPRTTAINLRTCQARARKPPAAPGLEAKCAAAGASDTAVKDDAVRATRGRQDRRDAPR